MSLDGLVVTPSLKRLEARVFNHLLAHVAAHHKPQVPHDLVDYQVKVGKAVHSTG